MSSINVKTFSSCTNTDVANAILTLAVPLFAACGDDEGMKRNLVSLAVTAWNLSLFDAKGADDYKKKVEERLSADLAENKKRIFTQFVLQIITTKQQKYPSMLKGIKSWEFSFKDGSPSLTVDTQPVKPI